MSTLPGVSRQIVLPGRGELATRLIQTSQTGPAVLLLHGWGATADVNFRGVYGQLAANWPIIAPDHRGHGHGIRSVCPFSLSDCADDAASLIDELGVGPVVATGYSMGGPIALLLARRHPELVSGLVLAATASDLGGNLVRRAALLSMGGMSELCLKVPPAVRTLGYRLADVCQILRAGSSIGRFRADGWLDELQAPTAVVITLQDQLVAPADQLRLAEAINGAHQFVVRGDHGVCRSHPRRFGHVLTRAIRSVTEPSGYAALKFAA
jgi:3-oxoadipate enol-lactonase